MSNPRTGYLYRDKHGVLWARMKYTDNDGQRRQMMRRVNGGKRRGNEILEDMQRELRTPREGLTPRSSFRAVAKVFIEERLHAPVYANGVKLHGMKDWRGVKAILEHVFIEELGDLPIGEISHAEMRALRDRRLKARRRSGGRKSHEVEGTRGIARVNREMAAARLVFTYAIEADLITKNPVTAGRGRSLVVPKAELPRERVLSFDEEARLLKHWPKRTVDYFIVALDTGMRESELFSLTGAHHDGGVLRLTWEITKSKRARTIPLSARSRAIIERRAKKRDQEIFADISRWTLRQDFVAAKAAAGVEDFRMHDCRATLTVRLIQGGMSEAEASKITGHTFHPQSQIAPTLRKHYLRVDEVTIARATRVLDSNALASENCSAQSASEPIAQSEKQGAKEHGNPTSGVAHEPAVPSTPTKKPVSSLR